MFPPVDFSFEADAARIAASLAPSQNRGEVVKMERAEEDTPEPKEMLKLRGMVLGAFSTTHYLLFCLAASQSLCMLWHAARQTYMPSGY